MPCFTEDQLMSKNRDLSFENEDLRVKIRKFEEEKEEFKKQVEEFREKYTYVCSSLSQLSTDNSDLKKKSLEREKECNDKLRERLKEKENMTVKDLVNALAVSGVQSVTMKF